MVLFTVLSGLGLGLMAWLGLGLGPDGGLFRWLACALALALAGAGGLCSAGHLGRRENAWRAFSQWRSSWLSREACLMVAAMAAFGLYAAIWCLGGVRFWGLGLLASALSVATIHSTAMIYAQLKTVPRWSVTPTPVLFLVTGLTGGLLATGAVAGLVGADVAGWWTGLALVLAIGVTIWWQTSAAASWAGCACSRRRIPARTTCCARWPTRSAASAPSSCAASAPFWACWCRWCSACWRC
jgi:DMSO reductase anchor subunit